MADPEHVEIVKQGAEAIQKWREEHRDEHLDLSNGDLTGANLLGPDLSEANLQGASLSEAMLQGASLVRANLQKADLYKTDLLGADLSEANLQGASLVRANLRGAHLNGAKLQGARLRGVNLSQVTLTAVRGVKQAVDLDRSRLDDGDALYFDECQRPLLERQLDWERLRTVGRLPLFGVSYTALILIPIVFYGLAFYNSQVASMRAWAETVGVTADHPLPRVATLILGTLHPQPIPSLSFVLLVSTVLLAVGSTLFTFFCPARVREFSREQWCDEMQRSLLHYWPLSWKHRVIRLVCAFCYVLGGIGALWVICNKIWNVARFIYENSAFPLPWR